MHTYFEIRLCFNFASDEDYHTKQILKTESPDEYFNTMMEYDSDWVLNKKGLKLDEDASNHPISYSIVKTNFDRYHPERNGDVEYVTYIRVKELKKMSRRDILVEMEAVISLIASEVKDSDAPLPKEDYQHIRAIREYCNQIIEEEIGK